MDVALHGLFLLLNQKVHAIQGHAAVVADDAAAAVGVGQAGEELVAAGDLDFVGVYVKHAVVVSLAVFEDALHFRVKLAAVFFHAGAHHADAAEGHDGALEGLIGLQAHDLLQLFVDIAGCVGGDIGNDLGVEVQHAAGGALLLHQLQHFVPQLGGALSGAGEEAGIAIVGRVVFLDELADIDCVHSREPPIPSWWS